MLIEAVYPPTYCTGPIETESGFKEHEPEVESTDRPQAATPDCIQVANRGGFLERKPGERLFGVSSADN